MYEVKLFQLFLIACCLKFYFCQRRIAKANFTTTDKKYMVYFVQSNQSHPKLQGWLCGGALVKEDKILTSAACLLETSHIYAIAGYKTYVSTENLNKDNCTKDMKRRVIKTCMPAGYDFNHNSSKWMALDIGVAVVDKPYKYDIMFRILCDYIPTPVPISYEKDFMYESQDVLALGWGFSRGRRPDDPSDYNSRRLKYVMTNLVSPNVCKKKYPGLEEVIDKYLLCTHSSGNLNDDGLPIVFAHMKHVKCCNCPEDATREMEARRQVIYNPRGWGICQNDHGGPLTAFFGVTEMLIGIAVNTIYDANYQCVGPALFTSVACVSEIVLCLLEDDSTRLRRSCTEIAEDEGYKLLQRKMIWLKNTYAKTKYKKNDQSLNNTIELIRNNIKHDMEIIENKNATIFENGNSTRSVGWERMKETYVNNTSGNGTAV